MANINDSINKGVPVNTPVVIKMVDLLSFCNDINYTKNKINKRTEKYLDFLHSLADFPMDIEIMQTMEIGTDAETLEKKLFFSYAGFISSISFYLNVDNIANNYSNSKLKTDDFDSCYEKIDERIEILKNVKSESDLLKKFPLLEISYNRHKMIADVLFKIKYMLKNSSKLEGLKRYRDFLNSFSDTEKNIVLNMYNDAENFNYKSFALKLADGFRDLVKNQDKVREYLINHPISMKYVDIDNKKLDLYLAYQYQLHAEVFDDPQRFLYYITNYFKENKDLIGTDYYIEFGQVLTNDDGTFESSVAGGFYKKRVYVKELYDRYKKFLIDNPSLRAISLDRSAFNNMNLNEVEIFMNEYLADLQANWDFLEDRDDLEKTVARGILKSCKKYEKNEPYDKKIERLSELFYEKKTLYDSTNPVCMLKGKNTFDGYVAFIYKNGLVMLDKFYENNKSKSLSENQAIYYMKANEFYSLSKLSKSELIQNKLCKRIVHRGSWQEKVKKVIDDNNIMGNPENAIKQLLMIKDIVRNK